MATPITTSPALRMTRGRRVAYLIAVLVSLAVAVAAAVALIRGRPRPAPPPAT